MCSFILYPLSPKCKEHNFDPNSSRDSTVMAYAGIKKVLNGSYFGYLSTLWAWQHPESCCNIRDRENTLGMTSNAFSEFWFFRLVSSPVIMHLMNVEPHIFSKYYSTWFLPKIQIFLCTCSNASLHIQNINQSVMSRSIRDVRVEFDQECTQPNSFKYYLMLSCDQKASTFR